MYSRITGIQVLDHGTRHDMLSMITAKPGTSFKELQDAVRLADGPTTWHLEKLSREGFVSLVRDGKTRRYFTKDFPPTLAKAIVAVREPSRRALLHGIFARAGASQTELAAAVGLSPPTALHHLDILEKQGLVEAWREGRVKRYRATETAREVLGRAGG
ncbi:MAG TPA: winged helix-turn-helix transcriptional regulator [Candidatus Thermoplasmatota archaeon]|nr:winged helix-turn-helix transcriptional regulator [Candidatus Thermoplasmatota archaeon]